MIAVPTKDEMERFRDQKPPPRRTTLGDAVTISACLFALLAMTAVFVMWFLVLPVIGALWLMGALT